MILMRQNSWINSVLITVLQRNRTNRTYILIYMRRFIIEIGPTILEARKSHGLPSAS